MPEEKKLFRLPEYDIAEMRFVHTGIRELMNAQDGLYSSIQKVEFGEAPYINQNTLAPGQVVQTTPVEMESPIGLTFNQVRAFDVDALAGEMSAIAAKHLEIVMTHMFQQIGDLCSAAGNVVDAAGAPLSFDQILDMLERIEISFDEEGQPKMPTLVMHPDMVAKVAQLPPPMPAQLRRQAGIMETKRKEFDARKRHRQLSRHAV